ncbi:MAG: WD40 repeat domain-containing protein [Bacteroidia bacterium]|nr:WD40 repeat domain-containing protein [Bacteroidia bacterium]MDW8347989.1 WD40 repeat domain-containing protein [Bacteroidia bacterium]
MIYLPTILTSGIYYSLLAQNPHINAIRYVRISPTGKYAASCSDNVLCIWSLTEKKVLHTFQESTSNISFGTDELLYKVEMQGKKCVVSQIEVGSGSKKTIFEKENLTNIELSPKANYLAAKLDGYLFVADLRTGQSIEKFRSYPSMASSTDLFFSYDEKYLYQVSNLQVFNRFIVENGQKDWEMNKPLNDKLMIKTICNIREKCFIAGKLSLTDKNAYNAYVFGENKNQLSAWNDNDFEVFKAIFNPATQNEVILASSSNEIGYTVNVDGVIFKFLKTKIATKDFLRDIDLSQDGKYLIVASSSGYGATQQGKKGYAKIEVYEWGSRKKLMEF